MDDAIISQIRMYKRRKYVLKTVDSKDCEGVIRPLYYISSTLHWYASNPFRCRSFCRWNSFFSKPLLRSEKEKRQLHMIFNYLIRRLTDAIPPISRLDSKTIGRRWWALVFRLFGTFGLWFLDAFVSNGLLTKDEVGRTARNAAAGSFHLISSR
jgi:hypothetical protein